jgi:hypothetical protein
MYCKHVNTREVTVFQWLVYIKYGGLRLAMGSSVGIATGYGLDGPGIESR